MSHRVLTVALLTLLLCGPVAGGATALDASAAGVPADGSALSTPAPTLVGLYPNPHATDDRGEFVVLDVRGGAELGDYRLCDGERCVSLPNRTAETGRVVLSAAPDRVGNLTDTPVTSLPTPLDLANGGETVRLRRGDTTVSTARYEDAPEGEVYARTTAPGAHPRWTWRPIGSTDRPVVESGPASVEAFVLPDAPGVPLRTVESAEERLLLAGYTFSSERVADALVAAHDRGVAVRVLVEGSPVGGTTTRQAAVLDRLVAAGVEVRAVGGPWARYRFHHAKYAVADNRALVLTENWKPSGVGGRSSRGWGAVVDDPTVAEGLADTFRVDWRWRDAVRWAKFRRGRSFVRERAANGTFQTRHPPERVRAESVRLLVAPDNAESGVVGLVDGANRSLDVLQVSLGGPDGPFTRALVRAARRGVETRILLSGAWYVREDNRALADRLNALADREDLPLTVRLAVPGERFGKVHAKGLVVDDRHAVVGSLNFNAHSARENREVVLVLTGEAVAGYYGDVFAADWKGNDAGPPGGVPVGLVGALGVAGLGAMALARGIEFEGGT
ncbi:phospholipase D-like domain-containing protein [Halomarina litorea]|uniref:phospholipase D-like domain-containing protein n=1 Tax=Halomarina litorea TaxID=2961595 RepID=UPI0020C4BB71|nr:phospholipase D-like domain-containing protein [Halomarina sp. BCD28]